MKNRNLMLALALAAGTTLSAVAIPAQAARVEVGINLGVAPPAQRAVVEYRTHRGYVRERSYRGWEYRRHRGYREHYRRFDRERYVVGHRGYRWHPPHWVWQQHRRHYVPGYWRR